MFARIFFIIAMVFSLTEVIVLLSYNNYNRFSALKSISRWISTTYDNSLEKLDFTQNKLSDKQVSKKVLDHSSQINLYQIEREYDLPKGLLHAVMHQESAGNLNAVSRAGAVGPFQFMSYTAKDFGLITQKGTDNRRDLEKSAIAAARYYRKLLNYFNGNTNYAIASYNAGEGRVGRLKGNMKNLPSETKNYVKRVNYLMKIYQNKEQIEDHRG